MATRTLNVLLTADSKAMATGFASSIKSSMGLKAGLAGAALGAAALGKAIYDVGEEFDNAADTIRTGTGKTGKALEKLEKDFKNVVSSVPADFEDAADAIAELNTRLGITGKPLRETAKQFLELSRITDTDISDNIKTVTRAFGDWEVQTKSQGKQLDTFFRASQASGASVSELASEVVKFGAPLRQVGFSLNEATAMFALFEKAGVNTSTMMPGLKMAMKGFFEEDVDPKEGLKKAFKGIEDGTIKTSEALKIFGTRAGGDMVEAIKQGRFHLGAFTKDIATGADTIRKAGKETMDTSENMQLLGNKMKVLVAPAAEWLYQAVGNLSKAFATMNFKPLLRSLGLSEREIKNLGDSFQKVMAFIGPIVKQTMEGISRFLKGFVGVVRGVVKVISSILSGDFKEAWEGVKDIFSNYTKAVLGILKATSAPFRKIGEAVGDALGSGFSKAWGAIKGTFVDGANASIDVLNAMIGVMNKIPFVEIGKIGYVGGAFAGSEPARNQGGTKNHPQFKQRGGPINLGAPTGDTVPAMLERGEYVLNRNAARAVGTSTLNAINYGAAPRFQKGGPVYMSVGGDIVGAVKDAAGYTPPGLLYKGAKAAWSKGFPAVQGAISGIAALGERFPSWIDGSYFVDAAVDWLKGKTQAQAKERSARAAAGSSSYTGPPASMKQLGDNGWVDSHTLAVASFLMKKFGVSINSTYRDPAHNAAVGGMPGSLHTHGSPGNPGAIDFGPPSTAMQSWVGSHIAGIEENLIHDVGSGLHNHIGFFQKGGKIGGPPGGSNRSGGKFGNINHTYEPHWAPDYGGEALPFWMVAALAESVGMPGVTMAQMAKGESGLRPGSAGVDAGGTKGYGLWAITSPFADDIVSKYGGYQQMWNPVKNAKAAAEMYKERGLAPWYGDKYVTGSDLHYEGKFNIGAVTGGASSGSTGPTAAQKKRKEQERELRVSGGQPAELPGLAGGVVPKSLRGLGSDITSLFKSPGLSREGRWEAGETAMSYAAETKSTRDDLAIYKWQEGVAKKRKASLQKQLRNINRRLQGRLSPQQRAHLLAKRNALQAELGTNQGRIETARSGIKELPAPNNQTGWGGKSQDEGGLGIAEAFAEDGGLGGVGEAGESSGPSAAEQLKAAIEEHTAIEKELAAEMKRQTDFAQSATATSSATAWRALADIMAGQLGPMTNRAMQTAGNGGLGSF